LQPGGRLDVALTGVGYPTPVVPASASLLPDDRFAQLKSWGDETKLARSNTRDGWIRS
jgi:hypothetical protein